jgi:7,8-dihydropterin-6-yl-methyl-4-(beta-D-ribofuranosyl)aminobenzene 5'-phosphate synthase
MKALTFFAGILILFNLNLEATEMNDEQFIQMTIVYDNNAFDDTLEKDWGFSCYIQGLDKSILFDTGGNEKILLSNMKKLGINPEEINVIFLSHEHKDHIGGLDGVLRENSNIEVWAPKFFSSTFKENVRKRGASLVEGENFQKICEGVYSTGVITGFIKEQSLILDAAKGVIVITGCAHPGIIKIITTAKELLKKDIYMAIGGFHMAGFDSREIKTVIEEFRHLEVKKVAPCHCSGEETRRLFAKEYKQDFIEAGVGKKIGLK